jgi:hypothetical protein
MECSTIESGRKTMYSLHLILTSNRVSRLFWFGPGLPGLNKMSAANFFKEAKAAAFRLRSPPAGEAKATTLRP